MLLTIPGLRISPNPAIFQDLAFLFGESQLEESREHFRECHFLVCVCVHASVRAGSHDAMQVEEVVQCSLKWEQQQVILWSQPGAKFHQKVVAFQDEESVCLKV